MEKCASYLKKLGSELVRMDIWNKSLLLIVAVGDPFPFPCSRFGNGRRL